MVENQLIFTDDRPPQVEGFRRIKPLGKAINKSIKYLGFSFFGALLLLVLGAAGPIFIPVNNGTGNTTTLNNPKTAGINDLNGTTRIIQIAGGSSGLNDGFGVNRVQIDAGGVIKLKATNAAQLFQLTADGYGEASFPWTFDNGILVGGGTNSAVWLFNPKNGLYYQFLYTDANGDTIMEPDNNIRTIGADVSIDKSISAERAFFTNLVSVFNTMGIGTISPTHKFHIVSTSNDVVGIDSTGVDSASMLHIQNTGVQGPFFDIHSVSQRWGMGVGTNGNYELRRSPVGTDPVNGTTALSIDTNSNFIVDGSITSSNLTNIASTALQGNVFMGNAQTENNPGVVSAFNVPVTSAAGAGTIEEADLTVNGNNVIGFQGTSDGSGTATNLTANVGTNVQVRLTGGNIQYVFNQSDFVATNSTANSNLILNLDVAYREIYITNSISVTNIVGYNPGLRKNVRWRVIPQLVNRAVVWPTLGGNQFGVRILTNDTTEAWTTFTNGSIYLVDIEASNTNLVLMTRRVQ